MIVTIRKSFLLICSLFTVLVLYYFLTHWAVVNVRQEKNEPQVNVTINFLFPMQQLDLTDKVKVTTEIPQSPVMVGTSWTDKHTLLLSIKELKYPVGQTLTYSLKAPTVIPFINKTISGKTRSKIQPQILNPHMEQKIPTRGPVSIRFNTMIDPKSFARSVRSSVAGKFSPAQEKYEGHTVIDYSRWVFTPNRPMAPNRSYMFTFTKTMRSAGGIAAGINQQVTFTTAVPPRLLRTSPENNANHIFLYRSLTFYYDQPMRSAKVTVTDPRERINVPGTTKVRDEKVIFTPYYAFLPDSTYKVSIGAWSEAGEPAEPHQITFQTIPMGNEIWVDVQLGEVHAVTVYQGRMPLRHMIASGGREGNETPLGTFYTKDRGQSFWSARFGEGATYWVRLVNQILVHSVPKDVNWQTKAEEHQKLGLPASHGCIRLSEADAKWFYDNVPQGTMVIIHR